MQEKVTLKSISDTLGVSQNTVSQALRGKGSVNDSTRKRILQTAKDLGYNKFNPMQSFNILLVTSNETISDTYFYTSILSFIEKELSAVDAKLITTTSLSQNMSFSDIQEFISALNVGGIIILGDVSHILGKSLIETNIPVVAISFYFKEFPVNAVIEDNLMASHMAVSHLFANGYKKLGFIGDISRYVGFWERLSGFLGACKNINLYVNPNHLITTQLHENLINFESLCEIFKKLETLPDAFVCANDKVAANALKAIRLMGMNCPQDIGILGFDNNELAHISSPTITTFDTYSEEQGKAAISLLYKKMNSDDKRLEKIVLPVRLIEGESTSKRF